MRSQTKNALLARELASDLIEKIERHAHDRHAGRDGEAATLEFLRPCHVELIAEWVERPPISDKNGHTFRPRA